MTLLRELSSVETFSYYIDATAPHNSLIVARINGDLDSNLLREAIDETQRQCQILNLNIMRHQGVLRFVENSKQIPLEIIPFDSWEQKAEELLAFRFNLESGPLIKVVQMYSEHESRLLIVVHHVICDGRACVYLLKLLLANCRALFRNNQSLRPYYPLPLAIEDLLPSEYASNSIINTYESDILTPENNLRTRLESFEILDDELAIMFQYCKSYGFSLTCLLSVLMLNLLTDIVGVDKEISIMVPVDLREKLQPLILEQQLGYYCSWTSIPLRFDQDLVKQCFLVKHSLNDKIRANSPERNLLDLAKIKHHLSPGFVSKMINNTTPAFCLSNVGKIVEDDCSLFSCADIYLGLNSHAFYGVGKGFCAIISGVHDKLCMTLQYPEYSN